MDILISWTSRWLNCWALWWMSKDTVELIKLSGDWVVAEASWRTVVRTTMPAVLGSIITLIEGRTRAMSQTNGIKMLRLLDTYTTSYTLCSRTLRLFLPCSTKLQRNILCIQQWGLFS